MKYFVAGRIPKSIHEINNLQEQREKALQLRANTFTTTIKELFMENTDYISKNVWKILIKRYRYRQISVMSEALLNFWCSQGLYP